MLSGLFNYDNPVWRFIGKFFDILILNILIFTIGASTTAVYYVTLKLVRDEEGSTVKAFFKSFRENFKQATAIWIVLLITGIIIAGDLYFFIRVQNVSPTLRMVMLAIFAGFGLIWSRTVCLPASVPFLQSGETDAVQCIFYVNPPFSSDNRNSGD